MAAKLTLEILGESTGAVSALGKTASATKQAEGATKSATASLGKLAAGVAAGYAVEKVVEFGKSTIEAAEGAEVANKKLEVAFQGAGGGAEEAAKHSISFADSLSAQIGVAPDVIKNTEAMLATFHSVSGEAQRTSGVFDGATRAAADLAAAGFGNMTDNAKTLGIALSDPEKGIARLRRVGVTLTATQQEQIKNMEKSGNLLGAQKSLLGDVSAAVGGMAAKTATASSKASAGYQAMKEQLGTQLLPIFDSAMSKLTSLVEFVAANSSWLVPLITGAVALAGALYGMAKAIKIVKVGVEGARIVWQLLNLAFIESPIGLIVLALVALGVGIFLLWTKVAWFRDAVKAAWQAIAAAFSATINAIKVGISAFIGFIQRWGQLLLLVLTGPFFIVFKLIMAAVSGGWSGVMAQIRSWAGMISGALGAVVHVISWPFVAAWQYIYSGLIAPLRNAFYGVASAISGALSGVFGAITGPFVSAWNFISSHVLGPLRGAWNTVANVINGVSITTPTVKLLGHTVVPAFHWSPPFHIPTLAQGGLLTSTGLVYAHAGEVISPAPRGVTSAGAGTVIINLNVPAVANPAEVGRQTVRMLQAYVRAQGPDALAKGLGLAAAP